MVEQQQGISGPSGALVGYARVSTEEQNPQRQHDALRAAGCTRVYTDRLSGRDADRPELGKCLEWLREGDQLVVTEFSRLSRSVRDLTGLVDDLHARGIQFRSLQEQIDTSSATGELVFHVIGSINQFIRRLIVEGTNEGLAAARREGKQLGRPRKLDAAGIERARAKLAQAGATVENVARSIGVSKLTLYRHVPGLREGGIPLVRAQVQAEAIANHTNQPPDQTQPGSTSETTSSTGASAARTARTERAGTSAGHQASSRRTALTVVPEPEPEDEVSPRSAEAPEAAGAAEPAEAAQADEQLRAVGAGELVDVDTAAMRRNAVTGAYRVTANSSKTGETVLVGWLDRDPQRASRWQARTAFGSTEASSCRTRQEALLALLQPHYRNPSRKR